MKNRSSFWDDDEKLIAKGHEYIDVSEHLRDLARKDSTQEVSPGIIAAAMHLSIEETIELAYFAHYELGEFEKEWILEHSEPHPFF